MFSKAIAEASNFTRPIVSLFKFTDMKAESTTGTFIHIDDLGHALSARHIFTIGSEDPLEAHAILFDGQYSNYEVVDLDIPNDLILLKIKDYKPGSVKVFPKFLKGNIGELSSGTPLIRFGFPKDKQYSHIEFVWNEALRRFEINFEQSKLTFLSNDGLIHGYVDRENQARLIEISSPALLGQSGGPVLTAAGTVVGLQSRNTVLELPDNRNIETGLAASHKVIAKFLEKNPVVQTNWS